MTNIIGKGSISLPDHIAEYLVNIGNAGLHFYLQPTLESTEEGLNLHSVHISDIPAEPSNNKY